MIERRTAELLAGTIALRAGVVDPFEPAYSAGVSDATHGRLFGETRRVLHDPESYRLGWNVGRYALLDYRGGRAPTEAEALIIWRECELRP